MSSLEAPEAGSNWGEWMIATAFSVRPVCRLKSPQNHAFMEASSLAEEVLSCVCESRGVTMNQVYKHGNGRYAFYAVQNTVKELKERGLIESTRRERTTLYFPRGFEIPPAKLAVSGVTNFESQENRRRIAAALGFLKINNGAFTNDIALPMFANKTPKRSRALALRILHHLEEKGHVFSKTEEGDKRFKRPLTWWLNG